MLRYTSPMNWYMTHSGPKRHAGFLTVFSPHRIVARRNRAGRACPPLEVTQLPPESLSGALVGQSGLSRRVGTSIINSVAEARRPLDQFQVYRRTKGTRTPGNTPGKRARGAACQQTCIESLDTDRRHVPDSRTQSHLWQENNSNRCWRVLGIPAGEIASAMPWTNTPI